MVDGSRYCEECGGTHDGACPMWANDQEYEAWLADAEYEAELESYELA